MGKFKGTNFLAIIACLLWASAFAGVKIGLQYSEPFQFAGIRFIIAGILLFPFAIKEGRYFFWLKKYPGFIITITLLQITFQYALFYSGLKLVPAAMGAVIIGSTPLIVAIEAHLLLKNDKLTIRKLLSIILGLIGVAFVSVGRVNGIEGNYNGKIIIGVLLLLIQVITSSYANILVAKKQIEVPAFVLSSMTMLIGGSLLFVISFFFEHIDFSIKHVAYYLSLAHLSLLSAIAFSIWFFLLKRPEITVSKINFWKFLIPIVGAMLAWILVPDEEPDIITITGMIITSLSLIFLLWRRN